MKELTIYLRNLNPSVCYAWQEAFAGVAGVDIAHDDIFAMRADAVVSPANSFGFMDGGIDLLYSQFFGTQLQDRLQEIIRKDFDGELPVGMAVVLETRHEAIPYLVSAPTMRVPQNAAYTANAYLAFKAALYAISRHNQIAPQKIRTVLCPGLATGIGEMPAAVCARQMRMAYDRWLGGDVWWPKSIKHAKHDHDDMTNLNQYEPN
jgi:O-acetyl-ADP-ribose deacetylase (regulator of RNase III)